MKEIEILVSEIQKQKVREYKYAQQHHENIYKRILEVLCRVFHKSQSQNKFFQKLSEEEICFVCG
jgi:hypothetical protein